MKSFLEGPASAYFKSGRANSYRATNINRGLHAVCKSCESNLRVRSFESGLDLMIKDRGSRGGGIIGLKKTYLGTLVRRFAS